MPRKKSDKPKRPSIWEHNPYGRTSARGDPDMWRAAFGEAMSEDQAEEILGDDSPWSILGIAVGSSLDVIKRAYRKLCLKLRPDLPDQIQANVDRFKQVHAAYVKLGGRG